MAKTVKKIVLTGGPCAGKTTAMSAITEQLSQIGYKVIIVPECATELIGAGIVPNPSEISPLDFQSLLLKLQCEREKLYELAAEAMSAEKAVLLCDRGKLDGKAYCSSSDFLSIQENVGLNEVELRDGYDAVIHLRTAAIGAEAFYTLANNAARTETIDEARELDGKILGAWTGHPHLRVIENSSTFESKIQRTVAEIFKILGEPVPIESARKFLVEMPDLGALLKDFGAEKIHISQTYLKKEAEGEERRVRQRGIDGNYVYSLTTTKKINSLSRIKTEKRLTPKEYLAHLMSADVSRRPILKERYCFVFQSLYFELDVFPFWSDKAILEIKLTEETQEVALPDFVRVIEEVTDSGEYTNYSLAKAVPARNAVFGA